MTSQIWNVPNTLSMLRILLAIALFVLIAFECFFPALGVFLVAAGTDFIDGWWARKFNQCTQLGRILDSFADKILICGAFIMFAAHPRMNAHWELVQPWMAVLIVSRELLITALRSFIEERGGNFAAKWPGKIKMGFQCVACAAGCWYLALATKDASAVPPWLYWTLAVSLWITLVSTLQSGLSYIFHAIKMTQNLRENL
ncbi:MAG: CDP-diacylglycerol--glycerol-3-phosphate 3-phosphatidyltransferase [Planctomycetia bacterium]|nr:CDP-diacylglycerol--glycerol-3-phosphate 3-phosphatidyltransferase [Planctomycetia bacterium]